MESTFNADKPYAEAIKLMLAIGAGPDSELIHGGILDPATNEFLDRNARIFHLLHQGAISKSTEWTPDTTDITRLQKQILAVSDLCQLSVLRGRTTLELGQPIRSRDDLLSAMALIRNITRGLPFRIVKTIELDNELTLLKSMAELLPSLPNEEARQLPLQLEQMPLPVSPGNTICTDPQFYAIQFERFPKPPPGLQQGLDAFFLFCKAAAKELDQEPPLSSANLERCLADLTSTIGPDVPPVGHTLAKQSIKAFTNFYSWVCLQREQTVMFQCGSAIVLGGSSVIDETLASKSNSAFRYLPADEGFEIQGTSINPCTGKLRTIRFGRATRGQK